MDDNYMLSGKQKYIKAPCFTGFVKSTVRVKICFTCKKNFQVKTCKTLVYTGIISARELKD